MSFYDIYDKIVKQALISSNKSSFNYYILADSLHIK